jgi:hypothetical protein
VSSAFFIGKENRGAGGGKSAGFDRPETRNQKPETRRQKQKAEAEEAGAGTTASQ